MKRSTLVIAVALCALPVVARAQYWESTGSPFVGRPTSVPPAGYQPPAYGGSLSDHYLETMPTRAHQPPLMGPNGQGCIPTGSPFECRPQ
jgi:hypothetical protein